MEAESSIKAAMNGDPDRTTDEPARFRGVGVTGNLAFSDEVRVMDSILCSLFRRSVG
jgi:hypothetical protein